MSIRPWLLLALAMPRAAFAQSVAFEDDFTCDNDATFGTSVDHGWSNLLAADAWSANFNDGVSPLTDGGTGSFGGAIDDYENFLHTGSTLWKDTAIEATLTNEDDDWMGLVVRYSGTGAYYTCGLVKDRGPDCTANCASPTDGIYLKRVEGACSSDENVASNTAFSFDDGVNYRVRLSAIGNTITCTVDTDENGLGIGTDTVVAYVDPAPLLTGQAGLASYDNGSSNGDMQFDDVVIETFDPDADQDGLPDAVETAIGSDPFDRDTDNDTISDRDEVGLAATPFDWDGDGTKDFRDLDSDKDGKTDIF